MKLPASLSIIGVAGMPMVERAADLAGLIVAALDAEGERLADGDVVVVAQKVVSKAEGRTADLATVTPSPRAIELARAVDKDARLVELVLRESAEVVAHRPGVLIVALASGVVLANAGIDRSNVPGGSETSVLLLPADADGSSAALRAALRERSGADVGVIINDSLGRAWRRGSVGVALGAAGLPALLDLRGRPDLYGRPLEVTEVALADGLAAAASLVMGEGAEGRPVALIRGLAGMRRDGAAADLIRPRHEDLFR